MTIHQFDSVDTSVAVAEAPRVAEHRRSGVPSLEEIPLHVRNVAALRGLGYSFRQIGETYGVTPQAASVMLARQKALLKNLKRQSELTGLSPRAVNCLGRLDLRSRETARAVSNLEAKLQHQRNCGQKTIREILDWVSA
jgi:hypothetical protein